MAAGLLLSVDEVRRYLKNWSRHPLFEDMVQEGRVGAWRCAEQHSHLPHSELRQLCLVAAYRKGLEFLKSRRCSTDLHASQRGGQVAQELPFSSLDKDDQQIVWNAREPDFAPALIGRLWVEEMIERTAGDDQEATLLSRWLLRGDDVVEAGEAVGVTRHVAYRIAHNAIRRLGSKPVPKQNPFLGVKPRRGRYEVFIKLTGRQTYLGLHETAEEAAIVYDAAVIAYGMDRPLNLLPEEARQ